MGLMKAPNDTTVWVDINKCKACDKCVAVCPAGVLAMVPAPYSTLGSMIKVIKADSCIGCSECELVCPDFAIFVADKKADNIKFAKLTDESKARAKAIVNNNYRLPAGY